MKFYDKLWENTKTWIFDPFILIACILTLKPSLYFIILNFMVISFYSSSNEKCYGKYSKKFFIVYIVFSVIFLVIICLFHFFFIFFVAFDDAGSLTSKDREVFYTLILLCISFIKIFLSLFLSIISQHYKRKASLEY